MIVGILLLLLFCSGNSYNCGALHKLYRKAPECFRGDAARSQLALFANKDYLGGNVASRTLFGLTEAFAKLIPVTNVSIGNAEKAEKDNENKTEKLTKLDEVAANIREDYEKIFWATGNMNTELWADDCFFADPFSSFGGPGKGQSTKRFKANADALGKLVLDPSIRITSFEVVPPTSQLMTHMTEEEEDPEVDPKEVGKVDPKITGKGKGGKAEVKVGWIFTSTLNLPWKPVLAAAGSTSHVLREGDLRIVEYREKWKSKPWDVVKRLFIPTKTKSTGASTAASAILIASTLGFSLPLPLPISGSGLVRADHHQMTAMAADYPYPALAAAERQTIDLFEANTPSVVYISTFSEKLDVLNMNVLEVPAGTGTGFVWDTQGHIVTNYHVIRSARTAKVTIKSQRPGVAPLVLSASLSGVDPDKDIAVLKVDMPESESESELSLSAAQRKQRKQRNKGSLNGGFGPLKPIIIGTSQNLRVGQSALAIGNPFGLDHTLTTGVVSGLGREVRAPTGRPISNVIQTDASINPGNSGGPLLDSQGKLIGMNTAIFTLSGGSAGIGFAVPVDSLAQIVDTLVKDGYVQRPMIGITYLESQQSRSLGIEKGVLVLEVPKGANADLAGMRGTSRAAPESGGGVELGDIIVSLGGDVVESEPDLFKAVEKHKVGEEVEVKVMRYRNNVVGGQGQGQGQGNEEQMAAHASGTSMQDVEYVTLKLKLSPAPMAPVLALNSRPSSFKIMK